MKFAPKKHESGVSTPASAPSGTSKEDAGKDATATAGEMDSKSVPAHPKSTHRYLLMAASAVALFGSGFALRGWYQPVSVSRAASSDVAVGSPTASASDTVSLAASSALEFFEQNGTFRGFSPAGVKVASSDTVLLLAATLGGECAFTKIVDGTVFEVGSDPTLETCSPETIATAQGMLDEYRVAADQAATAEHASVVEAAANAAVLWASMSFDAYGRPSLYGLQDLQIPGTKVLAVSKDGQSANVQVLSNGSCLVAVVSATPGAHPVTRSC